MTTVAASPFVKAQFFDSNGNPLSGGLLNTYAAGGLTPQTTYTSATGTAANTNPIVLDAAGRCDIFLDVTLSYHLVLTDSTGLTTIFDEDNIEAAGGISTLTSTAITTALGYTPYNAANPNNYISTNQTITLSGPVTGSGTTAITTALANTGVVAGSYTSPIVTINAGGQITAATNNPLPLTTKGDVLGFDTAANRIPVGTNGQVLTADSSVALGVSWQSPAGSTIVNSASTDLVRTGSSGLVADPSLTTTLLAGHVYNYTITFHGFSPAAGVYVGMHYDGTSVANSDKWGIKWLIGTGGNDGGVYALNSNYLFAAGWDSDIIITIEGTINTTLGGNLSVYWGNASAGSNSMTRYNGSNIVVSQVG